MQKIRSGFRLSALDVAVLSVGVFATVCLWTIEWWWGFVFAFVVGHFFLFCNVVRMARPLELAWAAVFTMLSVATIMFDSPGWLATALISLSATFVAVVIELRKPSYHGVGWQWLNPGLPAWWQAHGKPKPTKGAADAG